MGLWQKGFFRGMFINTGGVYQRRSHLREVVKGGIYIVLLEKLWQRFIEKQGCVYKSAVRQRAFLFWGGGSFYGEQGICQSLWVHVFQISRNAQLWRFKICRVSHLIPDAHNRPTDQIIKWVGLRTFHAILHVVQTTL